MEVCRRSSWLLLLLGVSLLATTLQGVQGEAESEGPSESECRPYIEKALKELETGEATAPQSDGDSKEDDSTVEVTTDDSEHQEGEGDNDTHEESVENAPGENPETEEEADTKEDTDSQEQGDDKKSAEDDTAEAKDESSEQAAPSPQESVEDRKSSEDDTTEDAADTKEDTGEDTNDDTKEDSKEDDNNDTKEDSKEDTKENTAEDTKEDSKDDTDETKEDTGDDTKEDAADDANDTKEDTTEDTNDTKEDTTDDTNDTKEDTAEDTKEDTKEDTTDETKETGDETNDTKEETDDTKEDSSLEAESQVADQDGKDSDESKQDTKEDTQEDANDTKEDSKEETKSDTEEDSKSAEDGESAEKEAISAEASAGGDADKSTGDDSKAAESEEDKTTEGTEGESVESAEKTEESVTEESQSDEDSSPVEELSLDIDVPSELRDRTHVEHLLKIDEEASEAEQVINRVAEITLRELKKLYENAIKPLEGLYKYRDLSNRHFGDAEIFSKPLILFMGPWSGGKSSIINYLLDNEYNETSLRTGAEPSPAYFNILMYGEEPEIVDGAQLAADFTFSGLQKFGQGLEERLRGVKLPSKLLEKVNIVEIPGILEVRKQVSRVFPFNDACQWFIDRADIIFLVYDPSKLDVGPETEAILDQLKGREHQTRIVLNKADQVKPEELMRVQGALIWNISPLMSSPQPPIMYTTSLWSRPYEPWAPTRLLNAQERAFLRDLRSAIEKRIENKIASARRFAVRVRNHAKMVDCYLTTYYNHKSVFGNRKQVADEIIDHPQDYHIYEGLSTLTNISRYDLPDPDVYRDFFKLNALYEFQQLSATCTYFRGCPINRLDVAIAYDLPELIGKHKRLVESALVEANQVPAS